MSHASDDKLIPIRTMVKIVKGYNKGKKAIILKHSYQFGNKTFLNYLGRIEGREGHFGLRIQVI